jgi:hypothetical protein
MIASGVQRHGRAVDTGAKVDYRRAPPLPYRPSALAVVAVCWLPASGGAERLHFMAIGDLPYTLPADFAAFERLITRINAIKPAFTVHVGDIKRGSTPCSDGHFARILAMFGRFDGPLIYTPGDNEWTDCHRPDNGPHVYENMPVFVPPPSR